MCKMNDEEKKKYIRKMFRGYKRMSSSMERDLVMLGFSVERTSCHIKLRYNGQMFVCPSSASDVRSGLNMASLICRAM